MIFLFYIILIMKLDNYYYINENESNFYLDNTIENFSLDIFEGPKGDTGDIGYDGTRGLQGLQGPRGDRGDQGPQGQQGPQGYRGVAGDTGEKGEKGIDGKKGNQGLQGFIGPVGDFGPRGAQGIKGDKGPTGIDGPRGFMGVKGPIGDNGDNGKKNPDNTNVFRQHNLGNFSAIDNHIMTGFDFGDQKSVSFSGIPNPHDKRFTLSTTINYTPATQIVCPPNSYLAAFGYSKKEIFSMNGEEDTKWCKENERCKIGRNSRDFFKTNINQSREGMPYHFRADCVQLM